MNIQEKIIKWDISCDFIPCISTVSNVICMITKIALIVFSKLFPQNYSSIKNMQLIVHFKNKNFILCSLLAIPIFNYFIAKKYHSNSIIQPSNETNQPQFPQILNQIPSSNVISKPFPVQSKKALPSQKLKRDKIPFLQNSIDQQSETNMINQLHEIGQISHLTSDKISSGFKAPYQSGASLAKTVKETTTSIKQALDNQVATREKVKQQIIDMINNHKTRLEKMKKSFDSNSQAESSKRILESSLESFNSVFLSSLKNVIDMNNSLGGLQININEFKQHLEEAGCPI